MPPKLDNYLCPAPDCRLNLFRLEKPIFNEPVLTFPFLILKLILCCTKIISLKLSFIKWRPVTNTKIGRDRKARWVDKTKINIMYCRNCGNEVSDKAIMCVACGTPPITQIQAEGKDWLTALLLCFFLGVFGVHRFYTPGMAEESTFNLSFQKHYRS